MPREDLIKFNGTITSETRGIYSITLENGTKTRARISGPMRHNKIMVLVGDKVEIGVSPYDTSHGFITRRFK